MLAFRHAGTEAGTFAQYLCRNVIYHTSKLTQNKHSDIMHILWHSHSWNNKKHQKSREQVADRQGQEATSCQMALLSLCLVYHSCEDWCCCCEANEEYKWVPCWFYIYTIIWVMELMAQAYSYFSRWCWVPIQPTLPKTRGTGQYSTLLYIHTLWAVPDPKIIVLSEGNSQ